MQRTQAGWLFRLARVNPTTAFVATLALVLVALLAPGAIGGGLLLLLAVALAALMALTWPVQRPQTRLVRLLMLTLLVAAALSKIV